jgi:hypothetical protein
LLFSNFIKSILTYWQEKQILHPGVNFWRSRKEREFDWMRQVSTLKKVVPTYLGPKNIDTILMHWMSVKSADNFQIREHSCVFFLYLLLSASWNANDLSWYISVIRQTVRYRTLVFTQPVFVLFFCVFIRVITKLPNSEQSYKGKVKTHNYINRQNQSTTGKLKT